MMRIYAPALLGAALAAAVPSVNPIRAVKSPAELIAAPKNMLVFEGKTFFATTNA